jgi:hypothetical protein
MKGETTEPMGNKEGNQVMRQRTQINMISPICFQLNNEENGKDDSIIGSSS